MRTLSLRDFQEVRIPAPWGHIAGRWYGNTKDRPILAIHGWLDNLGTFDRLIPLLPDYIGVLSIDLPGHGRSSSIQPGMHYSVYDYVYIIPRVMREYGWSKVSLMGHSLGGFLSFIYTSVAPHTVDMVISLDVLLPRSVTPKIAVDVEAQNMEKYLVEEDRQVRDNLLEPPSYTLPELTKIVVKRSLNSVTPELAKHLLHRQEKKSQLFPGRFYLSGDGRVKFFRLWKLEHGLAEEMTRRIQKNPFLLIKASMSSFVGVQCDGAISVLRQNNPHFEFYEVGGGTHHIHLKFPEECARYIVPFIRRHRPPTLSSEEKLKPPEILFERCQNNQSKL